MVINIDSLLDKAKEKCHNAMGGLPLHIRYSF